MSMKAPSAMDSNFISKIRSVPNFSLGDNILFTWINIPLLQPIIK